MVIPQLAVLGVDRRLLWFHALAPALGQPPVRAFKGAVRVVDGEGRHARPSDGSHAGKVPAGAVIEEIFATYDWLL
jgi:hypothetical protein